MNIQYVINCWVWLIFLPQTRHYDLRQYVIMMQTYTKHQIHQNPHNIICNLIENTLAQFFFSMHFDMHVWFASGSLWQLPAFDAVHSLQLM